ncbi:MAG: hypothetical protein HY434_00435, partial [Candidatus Liptonbacteria bacterium]|nr:hypothetical protein [Candidatus Liptonbacteria bacterium]
GIALESSHDPSALSLPKDKILAFINMTYWIPDISSSTSTDSSASTSTVASTDFSLDGLMKYIVNKLKNVLEIVFEKGLLKVAQIITDKFTTKELCIEEVCIGKPQLQTLLNNAGVVSSLPPIQAQTPTSTVEIVPTEEASSTTATSTSEQ